MLNNLLMNAILNNNRSLIKYSLKNFIRFMRTSKQYKEFMGFKKHLELTVIRELLTQFQLIEYAVQVNNTDLFMFLLKEFRVSYKDQIFQNIEKTKRMFTIVNRNGNIQILKEIYKLYTKQYQDYLLIHAEKYNNTNQLQQNIFVVSALMNNLRCLEYNLNLIEKLKGVKWIKQKMLFIPTLLNFGIINKNSNSVSLLLRYVDLSARDESIYTPLELACKTYSDNYLEIIEILLLAEQSDQKYIPINPLNKKCHLIYMIKKDIPLRIINQTLALFNKKSISEYRTRENSNLLHRAIMKENIDLIRALLSYFDYKSFFERSSNGAYPSLEAQKSSNLEIRRIVQDYINYKEVQEFMENEWKNDPTVPEKLLLLKKQLFYQEFFTNTNCKYMGEDIALEYCKNQEKLFSMIFESKKVIQLQKYQVVPPSQLFLGSKIIDNADPVFIKSRPKQIRSKPVNLNPYETIQHERSPSAIGLNKKDSSSQQESASGNMIVTSIQNYLNRMLHRNNEIVDEISDFIGPIISELNKQNVKYNDMKLEEALDPNKMTIGQKNEYEKHQKQKQKVFKQLAKDYSNKLKNHSIAKKLESQEQNDVDKLLINVDQSQDRPNTTFQNYSNENIRLKASQNESLGNSLERRKETSEEFTEGSFEKQQQQRHPKALEHDESKGKISLKLSSLFSAYRPEVKELEIIVKAKLNEQKAVEIKYYQIKSSSQQLQLTSLNPESIITLVEKEYSEPTRSFEYKDKLNKDGLVKTDSLDISEQQKEIMISYRTNEEEKLDESKDQINDILISGELIQDPFNFELNKIDEVSQMLENASPQISPSEKAFFRKELNNKDESSKLVSQQVSDNQGVSNFIRLQRTENENSTEEDILRQDLETPMLELTSQTKTPQLDDNEPLTRVHHAKNVVSDDINRKNFPKTDPATQNHTQGRGFTNQLTKAIELDNQFQNRLYDTVGPNSQEKQKQRIKLFGSINSNKYLENIKYNMTPNNYNDDKKSMFSGTSNMEQKIEMRSFVKNKNSSIQQSTMSNYNQGAKNLNKQRLPPKYQNKFKQSNENLIQFEPSIQIQQQVYSPLKWSHTVDNFKFDKYRYKDQNEANMIKKVVKNVNLLRHMKGSPLRLYPELFNQQSQQLNSGYYFTRNISTSQSQTIKRFDMQTFNSLQNKTPSLNNQKEMLRHMKKSLITNNMVNYKNGLMLGKTQKYVPVQVDQTSNSILQVNGRTTKHSILEEANYDYYIDYKYTLTNTLKKSQKSQGSLLLKNNKPLSRDGKLKIIDEGGSKSRNSKVELNNNLNPQQQSNSIDGNDTYKSKRDLNNTRRKIVYTLSTDNTPTESPLRNQRNMRPTSQEVILETALLSSAPNSNAEAVGLLTSIINSDEYYEFLDNSHQKFLDQLHAYPSMKTILNKDKIYYKRLKNSRVEVPIILDKEINKESSIS
ncbi:UNKNOWN [Stylonychia lemnae]|uniref:Ankyrin repeat-containing protein n=1 Tax=Stylonychia lemnae TaxID=5949 RepID=A0A078B455_STYLE|nr:UNKNOWN [Stylonychia lemnae]|eukprot:CDW87982.1 UNKNOWN [Stylonychia lemnae]